MIGHFYHKCQDLKDHWPHHHRLQLVLHQICHQHPWTLIEMTHCQLSRGCLVLLCQSWGQANPILTSKYQTSGDPRLCIVYSKTAMRSVGLSLTYRSTMKYHGISWPRCFHIKQSLVQSSHHLWPRDWYESTLL